MAAATAARQALSPGTQRVFFALWPDARVRDDLARAARNLHGVVGGRRTRYDSIHLTLAFIGEVDMAGLRCLLAPPADVATSAFLITLDEWGCWGRNGLAWAAPSHIPEPLCELAANLERWLRGAGFEPEHRPFTPHVTLLRKAHCDRLPAGMAPISWRVNAFALIRSRPEAGGARYRMIHAWTLD